jgi:hypothetical protein
LQSIKDHTIFNVSQPLAFLRCKGVIMFSFIGDPVCNDRFTFLAVVAVVAILVSLGCGGGGGNLDNQPNPVDPEVISGQILYSGAFSSQVYSNQNLMRTLQVYAYEDSAVAREASVTLSNSPSPGIFYTVSNPSYGASGQWVYELNPYLMPELSVSGSYANSDTLIQTGDDYIPPGSYQVIAFMELHPAITSTDTLIVGFAENLAEIDDTGDDAGGIDITLYDTIEIGGVSWIISLGAGDVDYTSATVTTLGWPLFAPVSNQVVGSDSAVWIYAAAPMGLPVALHAEPDPADAWTLMAINAQYRVLDTSDAWPEQWFEQRVLQRATMDTVAAIAGGITIDPTKAQIMGTVMGAWSATLDDNLLVPGVTVTISTGDQVQYMYSDISFGAPFTQGNAEPQLFIFNVEPPLDEKATITFSHPDSSIVIDSLTVPVRADELTDFMHFDVTDPGGLAQGVTISGWVQDMEAGTFAGPGVTMILTHENSGTIIGSTLTDSSSEFYFDHVPSLMPVYLASSASGYIHLNSAIFSRDTASYFDGFPLLSESMAAQAASMLPAFNEPAWNSTLQSYAWFGFEVNDPAPGGDKLGGVTFTTDAPGAVIYYWDDSSMMYTTNGPSRAYTLSGDGGGPQIFGYTLGTNAGTWTFTLANAYTGSVDAVLNAGEFTYWYFD